MQICENARIPSGAHDRRLRGTDRPDNLYEPVTGAAATHGIFDAQAKTRSPQLWAATHRGALASALASIAVGAATGARRRP